MVYNDVTIGKRCENVYNFVHLIRNKNYSSIIEELLVNRIQGVQKALNLLFPLLKGGYVRKVVKVRSFVRSFVQPITVLAYSIYTKFFL